MTSWQSWMEGHTWGIHSGPLQTPPGEWGLGPHGAGVGGYHDLIVGASSGLTVGQGPAEGEEGISSPSHARTLAYTGTPWG